VAGVEPACLAQQRRVAAGAAVAGAVSSGLKARVLASIGSGSCIEYDYGLITVWDRLHTNGLGVLERAAVPSILSLRSFHHVITRRMHDLHAAALTDVHTEEESTCKGGDQAWSACSQMPQSCIVIWGVEQMAALCRRCQTPFCSWSAIRARHW
jgi:hypothetical protein